MDISILIVNYKTGEMVKKCINAILSQTGVTYEVIVVDNHSEDDSVDILKTFSSRIKLIENQENLGFGKANNLAFQYAIGRYIFLLNPDARLQEKDDLHKLINFMDENSHFGLVTARVFSEDKKYETLPRLWYPGEKHIGLPYKNLPGSIAWVLGACMILPRKIYEDLNGFDEDYFLYGEDIDLCLRVRKLGFQIGVCSDVSIIHVGGVSERDVKWYDRTIKKQKALHLFYKKHYEYKAVNFLLRREMQYAKWRYLLNNLLRYFKIPRAHKRCETFKAIYDFNRQILDKG